jgi:hypothetical protein
MQSSGTHQGIGRSLSATFAFTLEAMTVPSAAVRSSLARANPWLVIGLAAAIEVVAAVILLPASLALIARLPGVTDTARETAQHFLVVSIALRPIILAFSLLLTTTVCFFISSFSGWFASWRTNLTIVAMSHLAISIGSLAAAVVTAYTGAATSADLDLSLGPALFVSHAPPLVMSLVHVFSFFMMWGIYVMVRLARAANATPLQAALLTIPLWLPQIALQVALSK